jgi:hypothetical protein
MDADKCVSVCFFEQDGGVYVQCKYGARTLHLSDSGNAVFVPKLDAVKSVLETFKLAVMSGELDVALANASKRK